MAQAAIASACPTHTFTEFTGIEYLQIDIAGNFGLDKENWSERIIWTESREAFLETLVKDAEEPALFYAAVQAYRKAQAGKPSGYPIIFGCHVLWLAAPRMPDRLRILCTAL